MPIKQTINIYLRSFSKTDLNLIKYNMERKLKFFSKLIEQRGYFDYGHDFHFTISDLPTNRRTLPFLKISSVYQKEKYCYKRTEYITLIKIETSLHWLILCDAAAIEASYQKLNNIVNFFKINCPKSVKFIVRREKSKEIFHF